VGTTGPFLDCKAWSFHCTPTRCPHGMMLGLRGKFKIIGHTRAMKPRRKIAYSIIHHSQ